MEPVLFKSISIKTSKEEGIKEGGIKLLKNPTKNRLKSFAFPILLT